MIIDVQLDPYSGKSQVIHPRGPNYESWPVAKFKKTRATLTPRQAVFYRNLIQLAQALESPTIPVQFELADTECHLDRGCIKFAEHAGFIEPLQNGPTGVVESIRLVNWPLTHPNSSHSAHSSE
jgi:hypothetical protein